MGEGDRPFKGRFLLPAGPEVGQVFHNQPIVVEHFFKVGYGPVGVYGVAVEAAAHVVVDAAQGHGLPPLGTEVRDIQLQVEPQPTQHR